jgi:hypothetical protein
MDSLAGKVAVVTGARAGIVDAGYTADGAAHPATRILGLANA